ncbi:hypothetical protein NPIL_513401 [Nephila pilipes]|uniref:Uncharacterized protein n=1 Tax=Nephila pilipes TaxID=299642 RepID=A0A8X6TXF8_NEPPI|nr:hypothetical protein NPIL_513401 [Nephila pilipes]
MGLKKGGARSNHVNIYSTESRNALAPKTACLGAPESLDASRYLIQRSGTKPPLSGLVNWLTTEELGGLYRQIWRGRLTWELLQLVAPKT